VAATKIKASPDTAVPGKSFAEVIQEIQSIYLADKRPWVVGFSGGKDSTAILQLTYTALMQLKPEERHKPVFVISSDTLVETQAYGVLPA